MKLSNVLLWTIVPATVFVGAPAVAAPTLSGDTIACQRNGVAGCTPTQAVVSNAVEFTQGAGTFNFDATGLTAILTGGTNSSPLIYSFSDLTHAFTGFSNVSVTGGTFNTGLISLSNGVLAFNLGGLDPRDGTTVRLSLSTAAVTEPATWAMMIFGMGGVGFAMRRRRSVKTTVSYA